MAAQVTNSTVVSPATPAATAPASSATTATPNLNYVPGEGLQSYEARVTAAQGVNNPLAATTAAAPAASTSDTFIKALQDKLLGAAGSVSSSNSNLDKMFNSIIGGQQAAGDATAKGIQADYQLQKQDITDASQGNVTDAAQARSGFATNMAVLQKIFTDTSKSLKDLDLREQEALAAGQSDTASKIADLKMQQLQMQTQAQQQTYQNLISATNTSLNAEQLQQSKEAQTFNQTIQKFDFLSKNNLLSSSTTADKRSLEEQLGLPSGILDKVSSNKPLNLQSVPGVGLVNVSQDANGKVSTQVLMHSVSTSTATSPTDTMLSKFNSSLADASALQKAGTREQFIRQLSAQYPQISQKSIADYVYGTYPDGNPVEQSTNGNAIQVYVNKIKSGDMTITDVPAASRDAVASQL